MSEQTFTHAGTAFFSYWGHLNDFCHKNDSFKQQLQTILPILHRSYGLAPDGYSDDIQGQLTMADLFR